jgi:NTP pyrophosphatase (non-canonical NTP hydrolase)
MMDFNEYQAVTRQTAIYNTWQYPFLGLASEAGEVCDKAKKYLRDGGMFPQNGIVKELGDVLWYIARIADDMGVSLEEVATVNIDKLQNRQQRNVIKGNGDNR